MRATSPPAVVALICLALSSSSARALRVLVAPLEGAFDPATQQTFSHAVEAAVAQVLPRAEIISSTTIDTSIDLMQLRDCASDAASSSCLSDIADAANAEIVMRPHLGNLGDELVLSIAVLDGPTARMLSQGQRRVSADRPAALLDVIPGSSKKSRPMRICYGPARRRARPLSRSPLASSAPSSLVAGSLPSS